MLGAVAEPARELGTTLALPWGSTIGMDGSNTPVNIAAVQLVRAIKVGAIAGSVGFQQIYHLNHGRLFS